LIRRSAACRRGGRNDGNHKRPEGERTAQLASNRREAGSHRTRPIETNHPSPPPFVTAVLSSVNRFQPQT
jgi:hypothetical protein